MWGVIIAKYTNAERMFQALERKEPDMVPHFELGIDRNIVMKNLTLMLSIFYRRQPQSITLLWAWGTI